MAKTEYDEILNRLKSNVFRQVNLRTGLNQSPTEVGSVDYNDILKTPDVVTGWGVVLNIGYTTYTYVYNNTGSTLLKGKVIFPTGVLNNIPTVALANNTTHETISVGLGVIGADILNGENGIAVLKGNINGLDTSGLAEGAPAWLDSVDGGLTTTKPKFPDYVMLMAGVLKSDDTDGEIGVLPFGSPDDTFVNFWNGSFRELFDFRITSDGTTIIGTLTPTNGHDDMTMVFSSGFNLLDTNPGATVTLTAGTDTNPQTNYVYILQSDQTQMVVSTSDWPTVEHIRVSQVVLQSATETKKEGALRNQNINNEVQDTNTNQGHFSHVSARIRSLIAEWASGTETSLVGPTSDVYIQSTAGKVFQMHQQIFPAQDMTQYTIDDVSTGSKTFTISDDGDLSSIFTEGKIISVHDSTGNDERYTIVSTNFSSPDFVITVSETISSAVADGTIGDDIHIVNDSVTAFLESTNLANDLDLDSDGDTLNNRWFSIVVWGVANKSGESSHLMCNLPNGSYTSEANAVSDALGFSNYTIPSEFKGVGFLMARFTMRKSGGNFTYNPDVGYQDLRGFIPNSTAGSGAGSSGITTYTGLIDTPSTHVANQIVKANSGGSAQEYFDPTTDWLTQYLLHDGTRAMTGNLDMGTNSINNITDVAMDGSIGIGIAPDDTKKILIGSSFESDGSASISATPNSNSFQGNAIAGFLQPEGEYLIPTTLSGLSFGTFSTLIEITGGFVNLHGITAFSHGLFGFQGTATIEANNLIGLDISQQNSNFLGDVTANNAIGLRINPLLGLGTGEVINEIGTLINKPMLGTNKYQSIFNEFGDATGQFYGGYIAMELLNVPDSTIGGAHDWAGTGWSRSNNTLLHTATNTADVVLSNADLLFPKAMRSGVNYRIIYQVVGQTAGTVTPKIGTVSGTARTEDGYYIDFITADADDVDIAFEVDVSGDFDGALDNIFLQPLDITNYARTYSPEESSYNIAIDVLGVETDMVEVRPTNVNFTQDISIESSKAFHFGDKTTDGSWRIIRSGNNLNFERRESSTWVAKGSFVE